MAEKTKEQRQEELKKYFANLNLKDWKIAGNFGDGGQADILEVKNVTSGELGVFRKLRSDDPKDIARFFRELKILTKVQHRNIVEILDYTKDKENRWYISKRGVRFETHWGNFLKKNADNPELVFEEGIRIIQELCEGLADLHDQGIIHRDIKPKNLVVINDKPVLIDFGIAFIMGEERYTEVDEAMANVFSPDPALNFMEEVPAWLDVFLLSQLLIWMVSKGHNKPHSQRPLDWRWVIYPIMSPLYTQKAKAITGLCSNYYTSPLNARELKILIDSLFSKGKPMTNPSDSDRIKEVKKAIQEGRSIQLMGFSEERSLIEARLPMFIALGKELESGIYSVVRELGSELTFALHESGGIQEFIEQFERNSKTQLLSEYQGILSYAVGEGNFGFGNTFKFMLYTAKGVERNPQFKALANTPYFTFHLADSQQLHKNGKTQNYHLIPSDTGTLKLMTWHMEEIRDITIPEVVQMFKTAIIDPEVWKIVYA